MIGGTGKLCGRLVVAIAVSAALGCASAVTQDYCPTASATGGDVTGTWQVNAQTGSSCTAPYDRVTSGDWCSQLYYNTGGTISTVMLGHPFLAFSTGTATFMGSPGATSGLYTSDLKFVGHDTVVFPRSCLNAYGANPSCDDLTSALGQWGIQTAAENSSFRLVPLTAPQVDYPPGTQPQATYNFGNGCVDDRATGGCSCPYEVDLDAPDLGQWAVAGSTLTLYSGSSAPPYITDFSAGGGQLEMSGQGGVDLLGQTGLRLLTFTK
jgi:hypothetical protein